MKRSSFVAGVRDIAPGLPADATIGMLFGASAVQVGLTPSTATAFSVLANAARAQLAAVELLRDDATLAVVVATILLINVRYVTFSAALAPKVAHLSWRWRAVVAFPVIDITYAVAETRFADDDDLHRGWYFVGLGIAWVGTYGVATLAGTLLGRVVGRGLQLEFVIPLLFIALLVSQIETRPGHLAALGAAVIAVAAAGLPFNLGLLVAGVAGASVGAVADARGWPT